MDQELIDQKLESLRRCIRRLETRCPASAEEKTWPRIWMLRISFLST